MNSNITSKVVVVTQDDCLNSKTLDRVLYGDRHVIPVPVGVRGDSVEAARHCDAVASETILNESQAYQGYRLIRIAGRRYACGAHNANRGCGYWLVCRRDWDRIAAELEEAAVQATRSRLVPAAGAEIA